MQKLVRSPNTLAVLTSLLDHSEENSHNAGLIENEISSNCDEIIDRSGKVTMDD
jgi:hypothetical protein